MVFRKGIGIGIGVRRRKGNKTLDVLFSIVDGGESPVLFKALAPVFKWKGSEPALVLPDGAQMDQTESALGETDYLTLFRSVRAAGAGQYGKGYGVRETVIMVLPSLENPVMSAEEAYFKLHLLSHRVVMPHEVNLEGCFGQLNNVAWTNYGPILPEDMDHERLRFLREDMPLQVSHVDKFPYLVNYHIPSGVRVASGSQVRLGAYLGEGTTVMPAGYVNFNAGTEGNAMIEGRVSAGVVVGKNSDVGGGASIMGTLSGGNKRVISIGEKCLLGANSGTGISLGYGCTIAAGLYVYAGMKVSLYNEDNEPVNLSNRVVQEGANVVKASALSGKDHLLFIQDSRTGKVICKPNQKTIQLNPQLHSN